MVYISEGAQPQAASPCRGWHIGEPLPKLTAKVITFQANGDELQLILSAMRETREVED
jgi:hypothetical protein